MEAIVAFLAPDPQVRPDWVNKWWHAQTGRSSQAQALESERVLCTEAPPF